MNIVGTYEEEELEKSIEYTKEMIPDDGELILLNLTGSRAYGWGKGYDYDIHGIFYADNFWGWCHDAEEYDLNMYNLEEKVIRELTRGHMSFFINMSNPYYIHDDFDYNGMMDFTTKEMVKNSPSSEFSRFQLQKDARSSLHCYRVILQSIHYLEEEEIVVDIHKLANKYDVQYFEEMAEIYQDRDKTKDDLDYVENELKGLLDRFKEYEVPSFERKKYRERRDEAKEWVKGAINDIN